MKINIRYFYLLFVAVLMSTLSFAQQNVITLNQLETGNQIHAACKKIDLLPGYKYTATSGHSMRSYVDQYQVCDVTYISRVSTNGGAPDPLNTSLEVGTTAGSFAVSPSGAASYNVPLIVPPGTGGMIPNLSVSYNSNGSGGMLGIGWGLSGLSSISRTSQTIYHDAKVTPVLLDNNDRFLLDGSRLIVTNAGNYGATGTFYGTEEESFQQITSLGVAGNGPEHFTVQTKDGSILEYGNTTDSRIEASGGSTTVLTWLLNKVTDSKGNFMTITYSEDNANGEYRPDHIDYTGNVITGLTPYNQIKFVYGARTDKQLSYVAGHQVKQSVLLVAMEMYAEGNKMHEYDFNYTYDMGSHLAELIEKGSDGKQYNSTKFSWENNYDIKPIEYPLSYFDNKPGEYLSADIDGDGFSDMITLNINNWHVFKNNFLSTGSVSFSPPVYDYAGVLDPNLNFCVEKYGNIVKHNSGSYDLNGDGMDDLVVYLPESGSDFDLLDPYSTCVSNYGPAKSASFKIIFGDGQGLADFLPLLIPQSTITSGGSLISNCAYTLGDFDGNGTIDLFTYYSAGAKWYIYSFQDDGTPYLLNSGSVSADYWETTQWSISQQINNGQQMPSFYAFDMNGDGKDEIMVVGDGTYPSGGGIYFGGKTFFVNELTSTGTLHELTNGYYPSLKYGLSYSGDQNAIRPGDFNGDGKTDMLVFTKDNNPNVTTGTWRISYSTGTSFITNSSILPLSDFIPASLFPYDDGRENKHEYFVADLNADGKADVSEKITDGSSGTDIHTLYSIGNNTFLQDNTHFSNTYSQTSYLKPASSCIGDFDGDGHPDILFRDGSLTRPSAYFSFLPNKNINKIQQITNGLNFVTNIEYNTLPLLANQNQLVIHNTTGQQPYDGLQVNLIQKALVVVSKSKQSNGLSGGFNETDYFYSRGFLHKQGLGFLGFSEMASIDVARNIKIENWYNGPGTWNFYRPTLFESKTSLINNSGVFVASIHDKTFHYQTNSLGGTHYYTYVNTLADNDALHGNITNYTFHSDVYGNVDQQTYSNSAETSATTNTFEQKGAWIPSRLTSTSTTVTRSASPNYTRSANYTNDAIGRPVTIITDGGNTTTTASYDVFGNPLTTSVTGSDIVTRNSTNVYDTPKGRFVISQTNALGHVQQISYDNNYGNVLTTTDPNQLLTQYAYDGFGRLKQTTTPTNQQIINTIAWDNSGLTNGLYLVESTETGMPTSRTYMDIFGRTIRSQTTGFDGTNINKDNFYNNLGQITSSSDPYYQGNSPVNTTYTYDNFLRPISLFSTAGTSVTSTYSGNTTSTITTTGSGIKTVSKTVDASGLLTSVTDDGGTLNYTYHACKQPLTTTVTGSATPITMTYDNLGRQIINNDPDAGLYTYQYNALGEIIKVINPNTNEHSFTYDALGRNLTNTGSASEGAITYTYDNKSHGIGKIGTITTSGNFIGNQEFTYDNFSRPQSKTETNIDGINYTTTFQYDNLDRIINETYPGSNFSVNWQYNSNGYLEKIKRASDNSLIWQCNAMTERGQVLNATSGNGSITTKGFTNLGLLQSIQVKNNANNLVWNQGYNFDPTNYNLLSRSDNLLSLNHNLEEFQYDNLDRLEQIKLNGTVTLTTSYANSGNISSKSDVGTYNYNASQPHAVTNISSPASAFPYLQQNVTYNEFKRASSINENINGNINEVFLTYGADYSRKKMVLKSNGAITSTKYYMGDYEKTVTPTGNTRELHYIASTDGLCAIYAKNVTGGFTKDTMYYINTDHLGSIALISDPTGNVLQEVSYDAWGKRRLANTWTASTTPVHYLFDRGYTGHEHLEQVHLINMNARLYDPIVGRMLNADDYIQSPDFTQSFNRYSYVINNPLKFIDPSGNREQNVNWEGMETQSEGLLGLLGWIRRQDGTTFWDSKTNSQAEFDQNYKIDNSYNGNSYAGQTVENAHANDYFGNFNGDDKGERTQIGNYLNSVEVYANKEAQGGGGIETANTWNGGIGLLAGAAENLSGNLSIGTNGKFYPSGWGGNQYVSTAKIAKVGKVLGVATLVVGTALDVKGVYNYYNNGANDPNAVHPAKAGTNLGVGIWGMMNPFTATAAAGYFLIDSFYPGGFNGAMENNYRLTQENRAILGPNFNLYNDMGGGW